MTHLTGRPCRAAADELYLPDHVSEMKSRGSVPGTDPRKAAVSTRPEDIWFFSLFDEVPPSVCVLAPDHTIRYANRRFRQLFGNPQMQTCYEFHYGRKSPCEDCQPCQVFRTRAEVGWEWTSIEGRIYQMLGYPLTMPDGSVLALNLGIDVTEHRRVEEALTESERQLRHLSSRLLEGQEAERSRISRELHEEFGQALTLIKLRVGLIEKKLRRDQHGLRDLCAQTLSQIDDAIKDVRRLSQALSPSILQDFGLQAALRRMLDEFSATAGVKITVEMADIDRLFTPSSGITIFRILQGALTSIVRQPGTGHARVTISRQAGNVRFRVEGEESGTGLSWHENGTEQGLDLVMMRERTRMLGGSLELQDEAGRRTCICFSIPVEERPSNAGQKIS